MATVRILTGAALALAAVAAQAGPSMNYSVAVTDAGVGTRALEGRPERFFEGPFATPGVVSASFAEAVGSVQAWSAPEIGMFKSITQAAVSGGSGNLSVGAGVNYGLVDTLYFGGSGAFATASFTLSWDTSVSGLAPQAPVLGDDARPSANYADSFQILELSYLAPNPNYVALPGCPPGADFQIGNTEMNCPKPETMVRLSGEHSVTAYTDWDGNVAGAGNGRHTGQQTFDWIVPVGVPVRLVYSAGNVAICLNAVDCALTVDASHSDYLGLSVGAGQSFRSDNGYQYLGKPLSPVPEPATGLLALVGLVPLALRRRRRAA